MLRALPILPFGVVTFIRRHANDIARKTFTPDVSDTTSVRTVWAAAGLPVIRRIGMGVARPQSKGRAIVALAWDRWPFMSPGMRLALRTCLGCDWPAHGWKLGTRICLRLVAGSWFPDWRFLPGFRTSAGLPCPRRRLAIWTDDYSGVERLRSSV